MPATLAPCPITKRRTSGRRKSPRDALSHPSHPQPLGTTHIRLSHPMRFKSSHFLQNTMGTELEGRCCQPQEFTAHCTHMLKTHWFGFTECFRAKPYWAPLKTVKTVKKCCAARWADVLFALLLLWLARALHGPCFFHLVFGPCCARPRPQNAAICSILSRVRFRAGLRAVLFRLVVLGSASARDPM